MQTIHLVCNAHLDPVWLWEWEEGAAEAISTFRVAAEFCEKYNGFVFNHNEVILYKWVEEYEPELFRKIQTLVKKKKWHIMGGWYLQPDCNMPSGESQVRQILLGRLYFQEKFGVTPTTAINFDPFGHTRGLVQIMKKSGYDSYLFCRPDLETLGFSEHDFIWRGYDGSEIMASRSFEAYLTARGKAVQKVENFIADHKHKKYGLILWGVGNHGGGPSEIDLKNLQKFIKEQSPEIDIRHSVPEAYFSDLRKDKKSLHTHCGDLNSWAVGCYTSQVRIKQQHRKLENELFCTEKMAAAAAYTGKMEYPKNDLLEAMEDLAFSQFHDILPGSSIAKVEETSIRLTDHALEKLSRIKAKAFFNLAQGQPKSKTGEIPILVYNPHPFPVKTIVECEFQLADQNWEDTYTDISVYQNGDKIPTQVEQEASSLNLDWRKKVVFAAELKPGQMNRFDCRLKVVPAKEKPEFKIKNNKITFTNKELKVVINSRTGTIDSYEVKGQKILPGNSCKFLVMDDNEDPWGMTVSSFRKKIGVFKLLSKEKSAEISGIRGKNLPPVRVIEDGPVRTVIETVFGYNDSFLVVNYKLPKHGTQVELEVRVHWNEKDKMLKLSLPTPDKNAAHWGQVAYGIEKLHDDGRECVMQKWNAVISEKNSNALTVINDGIYGCDFKHGELRLSLLRSPVYAGHPIGEREITPQDRYTPRIDQGERVFNFILNAGETANIMNSIDREAMIYNEKPMTLSFFPAGNGNANKPFVQLSGNSVIISAIKKSARNNSLIIRLFEPTGKKSQTTISLPFAGIRKSVSMNPFEIKTLSINLKTKKWTETDLMEKKVRRTEG